MEIRDLKSTITEMKLSLEGLNSRLELAKQRISKLESRLIEISNLKNGEKKNEEK